jgi:alpha-glucosidase
MRALCITIMLAGLSRAELLPVLDLESPDGQTALQIQLDDDGRPRWEVWHSGQHLIESSGLGLIFQDGIELEKGFELAVTNVGNVRERWEQPWGECRYVNVNEVQGSLGFLQRDTNRRLFLDVRLSNEGVAFRYQVPAQENLPAEYLLMNEKSEFTMAMDPDAWWTPAYWWNRYEYLTRDTPWSEMGPAHTPVTVQSGLGTCMVIHEAALTDYASMTLKQIGGRTFESDLVPWSDGVKVRGSFPMVSPWRVLLIADQPVRLVENTFLLSLNEPSRIRDTSWIKPAKYTGIWWEMHLGTASWGSGPNHGATTGRSLAAIDFAAEHGLDGVLIEGWNTGWDGNWIANGELFNFTQEHPDFDMERVSRHAREMGVEIVGHHETGGAVLAYEAQLEDALNYYDQHGVKYIKTGYVNHGQNIKRLDEAGNIQREWHHGQFMVNHYRKVTEAAAAHKIMLCVHEPIHDTGIRRTWPNLLSREGARGQEFNAWGPRGGNPVSHNVELAFARLLSGPMDFTPGIFDLLYEEEKPDNRVPSTLAHQLALYVVFYSPVQMLPDLPENYLARPEAFQFLKDVPVDWAETRGLAGEIGDFIAVARKDRNSEDWYLGAIAGDSPRMLELTLDFLDEDGIWVAQIYRDGQDAHWKTRPYSFVTEERKLMAGEELELWLAAGGGAAIRFYRN